MQTYGVEAVKNRLLFDNPWWALDEQAPQKFKLPPKRLFFRDFAQKIETGDAGRAVVLTGPRRCGKTVMVRQMVARLIEQGTSPRHILLASLGTPTYWDVGLKEVLNLFVQRNADSAGGKTLYAFLDELQYIPDWRETLEKIAADFPQVRLVGVTSAGAPLPEEMEEKDPGFDLAVLPPVCFAEFLRFRSREQELFGGDPAQHKLAFNQANLGMLNKEFNYYINYGGFPESVLGKTQGAPSPLFVRDGLIDRLLHKDTASFYGINDLKGLSHLFSLLAYNTGLEVSIEELARETKIAKNTLRKYLDFLESAWLIRRLHRVDKNAKRFQRAVAFKVFITSPSWYAALFGPVLPGDEVYERLVETAVYSQWLGTPGRIAALAYASWRGGKIDLVGYASLATQKQRAPEPNLIIEMDWSQKLSGFGEGPQTVTEFVRLNCNGEENTLLLTHNMVRTGYHRHVRIQSMPASLYAYGLVNELG
ncbi:AAA family ATPase [Terasakiella sp. SH-1]|uniref:ATP-binding protein n=1 Tax=Terasakiella sp. SH-1 TaxID=2560057 RepID=UPI00107412DD|nr:AAA family ATPase [Terasakiella sp. SH-1]